MIWLNLKIALRNLYKYRIYSTLNLTGLVIGFTAYILISLFIHYELSWDSHNVNYNRIFRVQRFYSKSVHAMGGNNISPHTRGITAKLLSAHYPEFEKLVIMRDLEGLYLSSTPDNLQYDQYGVASEPTIFDIFTYHFLSGNASTALTEPGTMVLSQTLAKKLFPADDPLGQTVMVEKKYNLKVTGVYDDLPFNSIVRPSFIVSLSTLDTLNKEIAQTSLNGNYRTYTLLSPHQDYKALNRKIGDLFKGYRTIEDEKIQLCPLSKLYTSFNDQPDMLILIHLYNLIGILILFLSVFNYINLTTAHTTVRAKEIAVRKVHGSQKYLLIIQYLGETLILAILAINLAFLFSESLLPGFNAIVNKHLTLSYSQQLPFITKMILITLITGLIAGLYPALFMSSQTIADLFRKNIFKASPKKLSFKNVLVILQFAIAIFLVILTASFTLQINYLTHKNLGFDRTKYLYAALNIIRPKTDFKDIRNCLLQHGEILNTTLAQHIPFVSYGGDDINWEGGLPDETVQIRPDRVGYDFVKTFTLKITEGRDFSMNFPSDVGKCCIINETAKKYFGYDNAIGKRIDNNRLTIVGVVKDYHYTDMHNRIEPAVLILAPDTIPTGKWTITCRVAPGQTGKARKDMSTVLESYFPNVPFEVRNLTEAFDNENAYKIYHSVDNSLLSFSMLNILLAIMGLLGLVSFSIQRKTKEIGIRKINGCSARTIFLLLTREYMQLLIIASVIAWPFAYLMIKHLPGNYKMPFPYWTFIAAPVIVAIVATCSAAYFTFRAALRNPVEALRYE